MVKNQGKLYLNTLDIGYAIILLRMGAKWYCISLQKKDVHCGV